MRYSCFTTGKIRKKENLYFLYNDSMTHVWRFLFLFAFLAVPIFAQQSNPSDEPPTGRISLTILREENGKPVRNAEVVLHVLDKSGNEKQEGLELKTHEDGK